LSMETVDENEVENVTEYVRAVFPGYANSAKDVAHAVIRLFRLLREIQSEGVIDSSVGLGTITLLEFIGNLKFYRKQMQYEAEDAVKLALKTITNHPDARLCIVETGMRVLTDKE
jgi:hypothetical protein